MTIIFTMQYSKMDTENPLLKSLRQKEERAYQLLYLNYYVPLVLFANKYVTDEETAKDLVQDFFISMLNQNLAFKDLIALKVYLYNGVKNRALNHLRHQKICTQYNTQILDEQDDLEIFWDRVIEEDLYARLFICIKQLPRQYSRVLQLTLQGFKIAEIADIMGLSIETVKEYKKTGKKRLAAKFKDGLYTLFIGILFP